MKEFELKLANTTYKCSSSHSSNSGNDWRITAKFHDLTLIINIPIESKVSQDKVLIFISSLHEALNVVQREKDKDLQFINQMT